MSPSGACITDCVAGLTLDRREELFLTKMECNQKMIWWRSLLKKEALFSSLLARDSLAINGVDLELPMETRNLPSSWYVPTLSVHYSLGGAPTVIKCYGINSSIGLLSDCMLPQCLFLYLHLSVLLKFLYVKSCSGFQNKLGEVGVSTWFVCACIYEWWEHEL